MKEKFTFNKNETDSIINRFGRDFYNRVLKNIEVYADRWVLTSIRFIPSYSANLVFACFSESFGNSVLKIGNPASREIFTEFNTLLQYDGRRFCKVYDADIDNGIILEEFVQPGTPLRDENSLDKRLSVFCSLYSGLHIPPDSIQKYPSYSEWVCRITDYMSRQSDYKELYGYMEKAKGVCLQLSSLYVKQMLLHGDFHHDNILLGNEGRYKIIDPKGVVGDPVFDIARFILNEFDDDITEESYRKIYYIIRVLSEKLNVPEFILRQCLYVETTMGVCWCVEDGDVPNMESVVFVDTILRS